MIFSEQPIFCKILELSVEYAQIQLKTSINLKSFLLLLGQIKLIFEYRAKKMNFGLNSTSQNYYYKQL